MVEDLEILDAILTVSNIAKYGLNDTSGVGIEDLDILDAILAELNFAKYGLNDASGVMNLHL